MKTKSICAIFSLFFLSQVNAQTDFKKLCSVFADQHQKIKVKCAGMANESSCHSVNAIDFMKKVGVELNKQFQLNGNKTSDPTRTMVLLNEGCEQKGYISLNSLAFDNSSEKALYLALTEDTTQPVPIKKPESKPNKDNNVWRDMGNGYEVNLQTGDIQVKRIR